MTRSAQAGKMNQNRVHPGDGRPVCLVAKAFALAGILLAAQGVRGAELRPPTLAAWENYIRLTEQRIAAELEDGQKGLPTDFLNDSDPRATRSLLRNGQVYIRRVKTTDRNGKDIPVPDGMVHHWLGAIFVPEVALDPLQRWLHDYDRHERYFQEVEKSRLLAREGPEFRIFYRLRRKKVITVYYNTYHTVIYRQQDARRSSSRSFTTKIAQLDNPGTASEEEKPVGNDSGFLWRLNSYWRFQEEDGGVFVECESVSLSRSIPFGLNWLIKGYVESIPRESLENTLTSIRDGIGKASGPERSEKR